MKINIPILLFCSILTLLACEGNIYPEEKDTIVVEGWIEEGGFPVVILTTGVQLSEDYQNIEDMKRYMINWAKVTVSDGTEEVILTGMYDKNYSPPYIYTTGAMRGKAGRVYNLKVEYDKYKATASTFIPGKVDLDSVTVAQCADNDTLYQLTAYFTDKPDTHDYYLFFVNKGMEYSQPLISYMGYMDDVLFSSSHISMPVYKNQTIMNYDNYTPYFNPSDTAVIKLAHVGVESFNFWHDVQSSVSFSTSMFMPITTNVRSNINGGVGFWQGYGVSTRTVIINNHIKK